mmetsp:Transcript_22694/g.57785  ORF Transcript_22694/g.57785 Transcript_22694/m.57785 type:complete len:113 (-) Transcript_22694:134-472(-)
MRPACGQGHRACERPRSSPREYCCDTLRVGAHKTICCSDTPSRPLVQYGADVNAKDNYEMTPVDRLASNAVNGNDLLRRHGAVSGQQLPRGAPQWDSDDFVYTGPGETGGEL